MSKREDLGYAFWLLAVLTEIPVMAYAGYLIGRYWLGENEVLCALAGAIVGVLMLPQLMARGRRRR